MEVVLARACLNFGMRLVGSMVRIGREIVVSVVVVLFGEEVEARPLARRAVTSRPDFGFVGSFL